VESLILWRLARRLADEGTAAWAVLSNLLCSFTLMRGRSLLSYALVPAELLALAELFMAAEGLAGRLCFGLFASLLGLDYELWLYGSLLAILFGLFADKTWQGRLAILFGFCAGSIILVWNSKESVQTYLALRQAKSSPGEAGKFALTLVAHLKDFFLGGQVVPYIGTDQHPAFPAWAWPGLAFGFSLAWGKFRWLLAWLILSLLPLGFRSPGLEPQRAILAWPALCFCAGLGLRRMAQSCRHLGKPCMVALITLPAAGYAWDLKAHARSMQASWADIYGPAEAQIQAIERMKAASGPFLMHFDFHSTGPARYLISNLASPDGEPLALIPWYFLPGTSPRCPQRSRGLSLLPLGSLGGKDAGAGAALGVALGQLEDPGPLRQSAVPGRPAQRA
jgi:hypothetical protein